MVAMTGSKLRPTIHANVPSQALCMLRLITKPLLDNRHSSRPDPGERRSDPRRALGRLGEKLAAHHLERRGFAILDRNVRTRHGEIDLIAFDGVTLAFVEVKTRRQRIRAGLRAPTAASAATAAQTAPATPCAPMSVSPLEGLRSSQRLRQRRLARAWLQEHAPTPRARDLRFDAIGVLVDEDYRLLRLEHVEGAW